jgi:hypothetical protein
VDWINPAYMSSNNSNPGSTRSRTISKKRRGAYVAAGHEDRVTRVDPLHIVKGNSLNNFVAEPDRARDVLKAAITDIATITGMAAITEVTAITGAAATAEAATTDEAAMTGVVTVTGAAATADLASVTEVTAITDMATIADVIEDDLPDLRNDVTDCAWSTKRVLKDAIER